VAQLRPWPSKDHRPMGSQKGCQRSEAIRAARAIGTVVSSQTDEEFIAGCCARAASGQAAAAPPRSVMRSKDQQG
jgi:hypothetical protein